MGTTTGTAWWQRTATGVRVQMLIQRRTIAELCQQLGRGKNYVSRRLNGHEPFKMDEIETAATWLGVTVQSFADGGQG